jgi:hypothetical protein
MEEGAQGAVMRIWRIVLCWMLLVSSGSFAQRVHVDFNQAVDFRKFKTYTWLESKHPADEVWAPRVIAGIDRQLAAKGLARWIRVRIQIFRLCITAA